MVIQVGREPDPATRIRTRQGKMIRRVREMRDLSGAEVAKAINDIGARGVTATAAAVSQWENGTRSPRQVMQLAIAKVLDVPWLSLFDLSGETL